MIITLFNPSWHTMGGGEKYLLTMADVLAATGRHEVHLLAAGDSPTIEQFRSYFHLKLPSVLLEICPQRSVRRRLRDSGLAIIESNFMGFGIPARQSVYVLQTPYGPITAGSLSRKILRGSFREAAKDIFRLGLFRDARQAALVFANSSFSATALNRFHGVEAEILYPPIDSFTSAFPKSRTILSVGRFFTGAYNTKRQDILIEAFKALIPKLPMQERWEYHLAGSCSDSRGRSLVEDLRAAAQGYPVFFHVNSSYDQLQNLYAGATFFWHGAGFGVNEALFPEQTEHFGMSTAEAMSAGCVPLVFGRGGQPEIVSHGESGYLWNSAEELVTQTLSLIAAPSERSVMAENASRKASEFNRERFDDRFLTFMKILETSQNG